MPYQLHYFTLRLWLEELGDEQVEWRGEIKNSKTGEIRYFRQGSMLVNLLTTMLAEEGVQRGGNQNDERSPESETPEFQEDE